MTPFPKRDLNSWQKAIEILGTPRGPATSVPQTLKVDVLRLGAFVNIKSTLSCLTGEQSDAPDSRACSDLRELIDRWSHCEDAETVADPRFHLQLLNALRALCRGHLARGEVREAESVLQQLNEHISRQPDREVLALTDLLLLTAWIWIENGKRENAAATLECTRYLLNAMRDPLLEWFQDVIRAK